MCPKNVVNASERPVLRTVRNALAKSVPTAEEELQNLRGLPGPEQKVVRDLVKKAEALKASGMLASARRLESQALQTVRRYRRVARNGPNPLTGV